MANSPSVSKSSSPARSSAPSAPSAPARSSGPASGPSRPSAAKATPDSAPRPDQSPSPVRDAAKMSAEAAAPEAEGVQASFLDALSANFGDVDSDEDGHLTDAEIATGAANRELSPDARSALGALRGRQGAVEEYSNDEWFDENNGVTSGDLGALDGNQSLDAQRIREEFEANRAALSENPDHEFAPLADPAGRSLGGHALNIARHVGTPLIPGSGGRALDLAQVDAGGEVDPNSRLGAYQATGGFREGTVGHAAHNAIGQIYEMAGTIGEDQIGAVFNSPEARALYNESVDSPASRQLAQMEFDYWSQQREAGTLGGHMGAAVPPATRDWLQQQTFR
jgi:hypothetical protein